MSKRQCLKKRKQRLSLQAFKDSDKALANVNVSRKESND